MDWQLAIQFKRIGELNKHNHKYKNTFMKRKGKLGMAS